MARASTMARRSLRTSRSGRPALRCRVSTPLSIRAASTQPLKSPRSASGVVADDDDRARRRPAAGRSARRRCGPSTRGGCRARGRIVRSRPPRRSCSHRRPRERSDSGSSFHTRATVAAKAGQPIVSTASSLMSGIGVACTSPTGTSGSVMSAATAADTPIATPSASLPTSPVTEPAFGDHAAGAEQREEQTHRVVRLRARHRATTSRAT